VRAWRSIHTPARPHAGVPPERIARLAESCPDLLCSTPYTAGSAILAFRQLGYSNDQILERIVAHYPQARAALRRRRGTTVGLERRGRGGGGGR